jgi:hypothetical protein
MEVSTPLLRKPTASTTPLLWQKYFNTASLMKSELGSPLSSIASQTPSPSLATTSMAANIIWSGPNSLYSSDTSRIETHSNPPSLNSEDTVETLVKYVSMVEHLPSGREVSPPAAGTSWADWSNMWGREMALQ